MNRISFESYYRELPMLRVPSITEFYAAALIHLALQKKVPVYLVARRAGTTTRGLRAAAEYHLSLPYDRVASAAEMIGVPMEMVLQEAMAMRR